MGGEYEFHAGCSQSRVHLEEDEERGNVVIPLSDPVHSPYIDS